MNRSLRCAHTLFTSNSACVRKQTSNTKKGMRALIVILSHESSRDDSRAPRHTVYLCLCVSVPASACLSVTETDTDYDTGT
jgi:hypothetical protein